MISMMIEGSTKLKIYMSLVSERNLCIKTAQASVGMGQIQE